MVFNRWGEKIFESTATDRYWDGTDSKGEPAMEGQYVYVVTGLKNTGELLNHAGTVYVIRNQ
jgi:flagellar hook assembly protein FlgD